MSTKKICFIAQFPPPIHGLSKAVETLYNSDLQKEYTFEKVNLTNNINFAKNLLLIWRSKADLFYFTISQSKSGNMRDLIIFLLLSLQNKKCIIHLHGGNYRHLIENDIAIWQRKLNYRAISKLVGAIVLGKSLIPNFKGLLPDEKIFIVPNCVDDEFLISDKEFIEKQNALVKKDILHILYLSNFIKSKGYTKVLQMAYDEKKRIQSGQLKRFHFNFAGKFFNDSERQFFDSYISEHQLNDLITYHGIVEGIRKRKLLEQCDIFVLLTCYPKEGQPISILEAMGNGMLILTTNHAGIPDIVQDKINGIIFKSDTSTFNIDCLTIPYIEKIMLENRKKCCALYRQYHYIKNMHIIFKGVF